MALRNVFAIASEYLDAIDELETYFQENPDSDEVPEHLFERLSINKNEAIDRLSSYKDVIRYLQADIEIVEEKIDDLQQLVKAKKSSIDRLKGLMGVAIRLFGTPTPSGGAQFKTNFGNYSWIKKRVVEVNDDLLPSDYKAFDFQLKGLTADELREFKRIFTDAVAKAAVPPKWYTTTIFDLKGRAIKDYIKDKLEAGEVIPGAKLKEDNGYVRY